MKKIDIPSSVLAFFEFAESSVGAPTLVFVLIHCLHILSSDKDNTNETTIDGKIITYALFLLLSIMDAVSHYGIYQDYKSNDYDKAITGSQSNKTLAGFSAGMKTLIGSATPSIIICQLLHYKIIEQDKNTRIYEASLTAFALIVYGFSSKRFYQLYLQHLEAANEDTHVATHGDENENNTNLTCNAFLTSVLAYSCRLSCAIDQIKAPAVLITCLRQITLLRTSNQTTAALTIGVTLVTALITYFSSRRSQVMSQEHIQKTELLEQSLLSNNEDGHIKQKEKSTAPDYLSMSIAAFNFINGVICMITLSERQIHNFFPNQVNKEQVALATFAMITIPSAIRAYCEYRLMASYKDNKHKESNKRKTHSLQSPSRGISKIDAQDCEFKAIEDGASRKQQSDDTKYADQNPGLHDTALTTEESDLLARYTLPITGNGKKSHHRRGCTCCGHNHPVVGLGK